jgi:hypothetical protein
MPYLYFFLRGPRDCLRRHCTVYYSSTCVDGEIIVFFTRTKCSSHLCLFVLICDATGAGRSSKISAKRAIDIVNHDGLDKGSTTFWHWRAAFDFLLHNAGP